MFGSKLVGPISDINSSKHLGCSVQISSLGSVLPGLYTTKNYMLCAQTVRMIVMTTRPSSLSFLSLTVIPHGTLKSV